MKTCVSPFTKGSAGRVKFAWPQTSGMRLFKLNFFGHTKTHICIHLWQKCAARIVPAMDLKGTWAIICAAVDFSLLDVQNKEKIVPSKCSPDAAASFAVAGTWRDVFMGKRVNKVKDPTFWMLQKKPVLMISADRQRCRDVYFSLPLYFFNRPLPIFCHSAVPDERCPRDLWP